MMYYSSTPYAYHLELNDDAFRHRMNDFIPLTNLCF